MKTIHRWAFVVAGLGLAVAMPAAAQQAGNPEQNEGRPPRPEDTNGKTETLTDSQCNQVRAILAKYDARSLTTAQAKAIHEAFRQAGLRGGPAINDAVKAAGFDPDKLRDLAPPPGQSGGGDGERRRRPRPDDDGVGPDDGGRAPAQGGERRGQSPYSIEQAISDRAQLSTIAFSGLAFITGDFGPDTFIPPGKVCDFFGFQYMRDVDAAQKGHNPMFLDRVAGNVLKILSDEQRKMFEDLAKEQAPQFNDLALKRFPLIKAFCRQLKGEVPSGSAGLNRAAVMKYVGDLFTFDAELGYKRAQLFGKIAASFTAEQRAAIAQMKFGDFNTWPEVDMDRYKLPRGTEKSLNVAYMTYASEFFSWYAGSVDADVYFCPERHGTYFGGFYMKDMPAMGKKDYDISTSVTGDSGEAFLRLLTAGQRAPITAIPEAQRKDLEEIIEVRRAISIELRKFLKGETADRRKVLALGRRYGELDGEMSWMYATAFAKAGRTLTAEQRAAAMKLRNLEGYTSAPAYIYSSPMRALPRIPDTDFLFFAPEGHALPAPETNSVKAASWTPAAAPEPRGGFTLRSPAVENGGLLPGEFTGFGAGATLPLEWSGAPENTKSYALVMHHVDPEGKIKWYWILYNIPANTKCLPKNVKNAGTLGNNSVNGQTGYMPPHSKGAGAKTYTITLYALSSTINPGVSPEKVDREALLGAMKGLILGRATIEVMFSRPPEAEAGARGEKIPPL